MKAISLRREFGASRLRQDFGATSASVVVLLFVLTSTLYANKYGSVEPIANPAVIDTTPLGDQPLNVREAFASRLAGSFNCR